MTSRRKIEKFCKENGVDIQRLEYDRWGQHTYGDYSDESEWVIECSFVVCGREIKSYLNAYTAEQMIEAIKDDITTANFNR